MPFPTLTVGSITIVPLSDGSAGVHPSGVWPTIPTEAWEPYAELFGTDGLLEFNFGSFLIHEGETWTLVDTGWGTREGSAGGALFDELAKANVRADEVSRVILTHMHGDHIGGNTVDVDGRPVPAFANAQHVVQRQDWDHYQQPGIKDVGSPVSLCGDPIEAAGLLRVIDGGQSLSAGISTILTPGHTPGHQSVLVSSGDEKVVIIGDVSHSPVQIAQPDWSIMYDHDQDLAARTRAALFERVEQEGLIIASGHYPYPGLGGIVRVEGKRRWQALR